MFPLLRDVLAPLALNTDLGADAVFFIGVNLGGGGESLSLELSGLNILLGFRFFFSFSCLAFESDILFSVIFFGGVGVVFFNTGGGVLVCGVMVAEALGLVGFLLSVSSSVSDE